ncbi:basic helix-loop-helix (bHLH) DNA-bindingsuperfamily protein [Striga asiatica]|uniref:Basic helix-loop-helix (BHLH) DNA-bindingsuperfamily protein n=1 Tax=Striga asiatica TaxID=4170 RepID=A0A5A7P7S3_STRAF|nr:basic helix-loop-helix (bHLH) DNA-bindingsuperfamily protein [Striga asiatica]
MVLSPTAEFPPKFKFKFKLLEPVSGRTLWTRPNCRRRTRSGRRSEKRLPTLSNLKVRRTPRTDPNPLGVKMSGKPTDSPRRLRNLCTAMSIEEIREAYMELRGRRSDP